MASPEQQKFDGEEVRTPERTEIPKTLESLQAFGRDSSRVVAETATDAMLKSYQDRELIIKQLGLNADQARDVVGAFERESAKAEARLAEAASAAREQIQAETGLEVPRVKKAIQDMRAGWNSRTREQILADRESERMGDFKNPEADVGYAFLAQKMMDQAEQNLKALQAQGREGGVEWQKEIKNKERYTKMLELTSPEARPTQEDRQLDSALQQAEANYNAKVQELELTWEKVNKLRDAGKVPKEIADLDKQIKELKSIQESNRARKILEVARIEAIPSADHLTQKFKTGDTVYTRRFSKTPAQEFSGWKIAYLNDIDSSGSGYHAILQRDGGAQAEFKIMLISDIERWQSRQEVDSLIERGLAPSLVEENMLEALSKEMQVKTTPQEDGIAPPSEIRQSRLEHVTDESVLNSQKFIKKVDNPYNVVQKLALRLKFGVKDDLALPRLELKPSETFEDDFFQETRDAEHRRVVGGLLQEVRNLGLNKDLRAVDDLKKRITKSNLSSRIREYLLAVTEVIRDEADRHREIFKQLNIKFDERGFARGSSVKKLFKKTFGADAKGVEDVLIRQSSMGVAFLVRFGKDRPSVFQGREAYYGKRPSLLQMKTSVVEIGDPEDFELVMKGGIDPYIEDIINHEEQHNFFDVATGEEKIYSKDYLSAGWIHENEKRIRNEILAMFVGGQLNIRTSPAILKSTEDYNAFIKLGEQLKYRSTELLEEYNKQKENTDRMIEAAVKRLVATGRGHNVFQRQEIVNILQYVPMEHWNEFL